MLDSVLRGFHYHIRIQLWQISWCISCLVSRAAKLRRLVEGQVIKEKSFVFFPDFIDKTANL